ncbi:MAG: hypothetical protein Q9207_007587, partial [Kuettlingeria erythrocarpa]
MDREHNGSFDTDQSDQIVDLLERPATFSRYPCPLCNDERYTELDVDRLEKHLGQHLKILATFALPSVGSGSHVSGDSVAAQEPTQSEGGTRQSISTNNENSQALDAEASSDPAGSLSQTDQSKEGEWIIREQERREHAERIALAENNARLRAEREAERIREERDRERRRVGELRALEERRQIDSTQSERRGRSEDERERLIQATVARRRREEELEGRRVAEAIDRERREVARRRRNDEERLWRLQEEEERLQWQRLARAPRSPRHAVAEARYEERHQAAKQEREEDERLWRLQEEMARLERKHNQSKRASEHDKQHQQTSVKEVIHRLRQDNHEGSLDNGIAFYLIENTLQDVKVLYRALLSQLVRQLGSVSPITQRMFVEHEFSRSLTPDQLGTMLMELLTFFARAVIVIDGLDKAEEQTVQTIFRFIRSASNQIKRIQLFVTSRVSLVVNDACWDRAYCSDYAERSRWRDSVKTLSIPRGITNKDIATYVEAEVDNDVGLRHLGSPAKIEILNRILPQSDGL